MMYLHSADPKNLKRMTKNPFLKNSIDNWYKVHKHIGDTPSTSRFAPIWGNIQFSAGRADGGFKIWKNEGVQKIEDVC